MCNGSRLTNRKNNLHYFLVYLSKHYSSFIDYEEVMSERGCTPTIREDGFSQSEASWTSGESSVCQDHNQAEFLPSQPQP